MDRNDVDKSKHTTNNSVLSNEVFQAHQELIVESVKLALETASNLPLSISRGDVPGSQPAGAYGRKVTGGASTSNLLWANGTWQIPDQSVGERIQIQSTSDSDGVGGTGIRSIHLHYLDANLVEQSEEVILNGTTVVLTSATDIRFIQCGHLDTYGTAKKSIGVITFTKEAAPTTIYNEIEAGEVRCSSSLRMVPSGKRLVVTGLVASSVSGTAAASTTVQLAVSDFANHDFTLDEILIPIGSVGLQDSSESFNLPIPHIAKTGTLVGMLCATDKSAIITGDWFGWVEAI